MSGPKSQAAMVMVIILAILFLGAATAPDASANPLPPPRTDYGDGGPYIPEPDNPYEIVDTTNLSFMSESLVFKVKTNNDLNVEAEYVFKNKGGIWINTTITLPFLNKPYDLEVLVDGSDVEAYLDRNRFSPVPAPLKDYVGKFMYVAYFPISVGPNETTEVVAKYLRSYYSQSSAATEDFEIRYLAVTGQLWPDPIESAEFLFKIPKSLVADIEDQSDMKREEKGDYLELKLSYKSWVPLKNVVVKWYNYNLEGIGCISLIVLILVFVPVALFLAFRHEKRKRAQKMRDYANQHHQHYGQPPQIPIQGPNSLDRPPP